MIRQHFFETNALVSWALIWTVILTGSVQADTYTWVPPGGSTGGWQTAARWTGGATFPNLADDTAILGLPGTTGAFTTFQFQLNGSRTIGNLQVNHTAATYTSQIAVGTDPLSALTFSVTSGPAMYTEAAVVGGGAFQINVPINLLSDLLVTQDHGTTNNGTVFSGKVNAAAGITFTKAGNANLSLTNTAALTGGEGFFGSYLVESGTLRFTSNTLLANATSLTVNAGGQFQYNPANDTISTINLGTGASLKIDGEGSAIGTTNDGALRFQGPNTNTDFASPIEVIGSSTEINVSPSTATANLTKVISGAGGFTKIGNGVLTLAGSDSNAHLAGTAASDGQLILNKSGGAIAVPGTLSIGGSALVIIQRDEQIANDALVRFTSTTPMAGTLRVGGLNRQETVGAILSVNTNSGTIEANNTDPSSVATLTIAGTQLSKFDGLIRDNASNPGKLAIVKNGAASLELTNDLNAYSGGTTVNQGTLFVSNSTGSATGAGAVTINNTGILSGSGIATGALAVATGGHVAPGPNAVSTTGVLTVGDTTFNSGSFLDIELGGTVFNPGTQVDFDRLAIVNGGVGTAAFAGTLNVSLVNGFIPAVNDAFHIVTADGSLTGTFTENLPVLSGGNTWQVNYLTNYVELKVVAGPAGVPGDYNNNGTVDAADYVLWRNGGPLQNQVDDPMVVNDQDYVEWRARFGNTAPGSGSLSDSGAVPEPTTALLAAFAITALLASSRKR